MSVPTSKWLIIGTFIVLFVVAVLLLARILNRGIKPWIRLLIVIAVIVLIFLAAIFFKVLSMVSS